MREQRVEELKHFSSFSATDIFEVKRESEMKETGYKVSREDRKEEWRFKDVAKLEHLKSFISAFK